MRCCGLCVWYRVSTVDDWLWCSDSGVSATLGATENTVKAAALPPSLLPHSDNTAQHQSSTHCSALRNVWAKSPWRCWRVVDHCDLVWGGASQDWSGDLRPVLPVSSTTLIPSFPPPPPTSGHLITMLQYHSSKRRHNSAPTQLTRIQCRFYQLLSSSALHYNANYNRLWLTGNPRSNCISLCLFIPILLTFSHHLLSEKMKYYTICVIRISQHICSISWGINLPF